LAPFTGIGPSGEEEGNVKKSALVLFVFIGLLWTAAHAYDAQQIQAALTAQGFVERAARVGPEEVVPKATIRGATAGEAVFVHDPVTGDCVYGVVPLLSAAGDLVGLVGVSTDGTAMQWCTFNPWHDSFPAVSSSDADRIFRAGTRDLSMPEGPDRPLLVEGADKHLYWRFEIGEDFWLVDAMDREAAVLGSRDGSAVRAMTPSPVLLRRGEDGSNESPSMDAPGRAAILGAEPPAAYCLAGIPYHFQITDWYCGPASLQMIMDYLGEEIGQDNIADVANDIVNSGCYSDDMRRAAHFSGMSTAIQDPSLQGYVERQLGYACMERSFLTNIGTRVKSTVYQGFPVYTLTWFGATHSSGHYRVVKGYDDNLNVFIIHDPWYSGYPSGPDLLIDQDFFVDNLWAYSGHWCMILSPWVLNPDVPASVAQGDTFTVALEVVYPAASAFVNQYMCSACEAAISLPAGLALAGGSSTVSLPNMQSGDTTNVSWNVIAQGPAGDWGIAFRAQGTVTASTGSYPSYTDSIGGHAYETVEIGGSIAAGWEDEVRLTDGDGSSQTCFPGARAMVVGHDGTVHIVWADTRDGNSEIYYRERVEGTWQAEVRLTQDASCSFSPCIAEDPAGGLHVAWVDARDGNDEIYCKAWDSIGGWSADERVTTYGEVDCCPAIAAGDTAVYIAWERRLGGAYRVAAVGFSVRSALGWSAPVDVDDSPTRDSYRPSIAYGADGLVHLVYERQTANDPDEMEKVVYKSWNGIAWSGRTGISSDVSFSRTPVIAAASDSTLHVVWQDGENTGGDIFYAKYDGASWLGVEEIVTGGTEAGTPSVAVGGAGSVHVAWVDNRNGDSEIYAITNDGSGWGDQIRLTAAVEASLLPTIAADAAGGIYVVWTDMRNGNADLYFRESRGQSGVPAAGRDVIDQRAVLLSVPHPRPFTSEVAFEVRLAGPTDVSVEVFDVLGRNIRQILSGKLTSGVHALTWDGKDGLGREAAPGVYFLRCASPYGHMTERVVRLR
jgi:hypothetical protein